MKTSLQWLRIYLPDAPDALACGDKLTLAGLPTETFEKYLTDDVFDAEITSNRSDCLSHLGIARELAALLNLAVVEPPITVPAGQIGPGSLPSVSIEDQATCSIYTARVIKGVKIGPSPAWLQRDLMSIGLRPINNVVDITNFVLMELGQPLHAFDLAKVAGPQIVVRKARAGEELVSLDGHVRKLDPAMLVIADAQKPVALAGIMGGKESEVTETTTDILLESAIFEPLTIRRTSRRLGLRSDSSYRFERGIDPTLPRKASLRAARLILELAGGTLVEGEAFAGKPAPAPKKLTLRFERLKRILGYEISREAAIDALTRLRLAPVEEDNHIKVTIPPDRLDLNIEVDLVEEVARVTGYEHIPQKNAIEIRLTEPDLTARSMSLVNEVAVGAGYFEAITFSFASDNLATDFMPVVAKGLPKADHGTRKADAQLRPSLLPGLLEALRRNEASGNGAVKLYETGSTFYLSDTSQIVEKRKLALVGGTSLAATRGAIETLLTRLDARRPIRITAGKVPGYDAAGIIHWGDLPVGVLGQVSKSVLAKVDLRHTPTAAELDLPPLIEHTRHVPQLSPLPRFPAVERDVSLVVAESVAYDQIAHLIPPLNLTNLETVQHVTTYRGKPLEKGTKSVTLRLIFRAADKSLKTEDVDGAIAAFVASAQSAVSATLRV